MPQVSFAMFQSLAEPGRSEGSNTTSTDRYSGLRSANLLFPGTAPGWMPYAGKGETLSWEI